jgi:hypothetical protein
MTGLPIDNAPAGITVAAHGAADRGQVVYRTGSDGSRLALLVPDSVGAAGTAAVEALEEVDDRAAAEAALGDLVAEASARHANPAADTPEQRAEHSEIAAALASEQAQILAPTARLRKRRRQCQQSRT